MPFEIQRRIAEHVSTPERANLADAPTTASSRSRVSGDSYAAQSASLAPGATHHGYAVQRAALLPGAAVQLDSGGASHEGGIRDTAARGVAGSGSALPHLDVIQASFGRHDVSGVRAHVGGAAGDAAAQIGAQGYAMGSSVAFAEAPDLHLAAHEAAHVVQQRAGVSLKGGVGAEGDVYERHADAVADAVVRGQSAEALLDAYAGGGAGGGGGVQLKGKPLYISEAKVDQTFTAWVRAISASRRLPENDPSVLKAAANRTKAQVGPGNFAKFASNGGVCWIGPITYYETPKPKEESFSSEGFYAHLDRQDTALRAAATKLQGAVARAEHQTHKLKSPEGVKGFLYQVTAGTMGLGATAIRGLDYAAKKVDPVGKLIDKGLDKAMGTKSKPEKSIADKGAELGEHATTSVEIMTGKLNELYQQTRPSYGNFTAARDRFWKASKDYGMAGGMIEAGSAIGAMRTALGEMQAAARAYQAKLDELGILGKAGAYDSLDGAIIDAHKVAITKAVSKLGGLSPISDISKKAGEKVTERVPGAVGENLGKVVDKGVGKVTGIPQKVGEKQLKKSAGVE